MLRKLLFCSLMLAACKGNAGAPDATDKEASTGSPDAGKTLAGQFFHPDARLNAIVDSIFRSLSPREKAAQLIMTASSTSEKLGYPYSAAKAMVLQDVAANIVFLKGQSTEFRQETRELNQLKAAKGKLKPLFACDCEPTLLPGKWTDITGIKPASEQKDAATVTENTEKINEIVKKAGVQLNFAPVVDIALNKSVINKRSFGSDPEEISTLSQQFVATSQEAGIGATLKHFPGHGAVKGDSHKQSVFIDGELTELPTFKSIIQSATPPVAVMVGHIIVKNNKHYNTDGLPATLSRVIVTDLLRNQLRFEGIITTDALNMEAAAKVPDADWKAVQAGIDLVLMPKDAAALNKKIVAALSGNDALSRQLETSIKRIIRYKVVSAQ
ncbi:glycoside hydrolase family 3 N-terminal domain-containing protein [Taibaiella koreensis]|uniref:glycoside hydrolase family 3 N-terminal domain-containing protein n=1 Tax=Taibaiella koreensis TaxID=1268548 RepID=UPI000E59E4FB|nr:glycoside hydrolase family 3 N-terminal domain-containing protein [Taibaiella koreensis]